MCHKVTTVNIYDIILSFFQFNIQFIYPNTIQYNFLY